MPSGKLRQALAQCGHSGFPRTSPSADLSGTAESVFIYLGAVPSTRDTCQCSLGGAGAPLDLGPLRNTSEGGRGEAIGVDRNAGLIPAKGEGRGIGKKALLRRKTPDSVQLWKSPGQPEAEPRAKTADGRSPTLGKQGLAPVPPLCTAVSQGQPGERKDRVQMPYQVLRCSSWKLSANHVPWGSFSQRRSDCFTSMAIMLTS